MSPAEYLADLNGRGVHLAYRLTISAPHNTLQTSDHDKLQQLKPLLVKLLVEKQLTDMVTQSANEERRSPLPSTVRLHMLDKRSCVTHDESKCYMWTREQPGYGWWHASVFPPPLI